MSIYFLLFFNISCGISFQGDCKIKRPVIGTYVLKDSDFNNYGKVKHTITIVDSSTAISIYLMEGGIKYIDTVSYEFSYSLKANITNRYSIAFSPFKVYNGTPMPHPIGVAEKDTIYPRLSCGYYMDKKCSVFKFTTQWLSPDFDYILGDVSGSVSKHR